MERLGTFRGDALAAIAGAAGLPSFYVAPGGSDAASGSLAAPFATLTQAVAAMGASSTIKQTYVRGGTYPVTAAMTFGAVATGTKIMAYPGEAPVFSTTTIANLITFNGASNVTVQRLSFQGATVVTDVAAVTFIGGSGNRVVANNWTSCNQGLLLNGSTGALVSGNQFDTTGFCAIELKDGANACRIASNKVTTVTNTYTQGGGVYVHGCDDTVIEHNEIAECGGAGISVSNFDGPAAPIYTINRRSIIRYNVVRNSCKAASDSGAIYTVGRAEIDTKCKIVGNYIDGVDNPGAADPHVIGIYLDDEVNGVLVRDNIVRGVRSNMAQFHANKFCEMTNNIFDMTFGAVAGILFQDASYAQSTQTNALGTIGPNYFRRNIFYKGNGALTPYVDLSGGTRVIANNLYPTGTTTAAPSLDSTMQFGSPAFMDPTLGDYTIGPGNDAGLIGFVPIDQSRMGLKPTTETWF